MGARKSKKDLRRDQRHKLKKSLKNESEELDDKQKIQTRRKPWEGQRKLKYLVRNSKLEITELLTKCPPIEEVVVEDPLPPFAPIFCVNIKSGYMEICLN